MRADIFFLGVILFLGGIIVGIYETSEESIIAPCVDGDGDINLEGIMCDKNNYYLFGFDQESGKGEFLSFLIAFIIMIGFLLILLGLIMGDKK